MTQAYDHVADLVSKIRNARFGEMVRHVEALIESGEWKQYTPPIGFHYEFRSHEFDYFLLAEEIEPALIRTAYAAARDIEGISAKRIRLADLTGDGKTPSKRQRRDWQEIVEAFRNEPTGVAGRIRRASQSRKAWDRFVSETVSQAARDPERRREAQQGKPIRYRPGKRHRWTVEWSDDRPKAEHIAEKILADEVLARDVYNKLQATRVSTYRANKRRSQA